MSITLELTPAEESLLNEVATQAGTDVPTYLKAMALKAAQQEREAGRHWDRTEALARRAVRDAQDDLQRKGISLVYECEGILVEESPDETRRPLSAESA